MGELGSKDRRRSRLLVLDVDHTLLYAPTYDPLLEVVSGASMTRKAFFDALPTGGVTIQVGRPELVYPRPHLATFIQEAKAMGYDLGICTTATLDYIELLLPRCGVELSLFSVVVTREDLSRSGGKLVKNLHRFSEFGYSLDDVVAIDDREDIHQHTENLLTIKPFNISRDDFREDK
ncbi:HAD family hydrolase, partial [Gilvimarinus sp. SDUM040013]